MAAVLQGADFPRCAATCALRVHQKPKKVEFIVADAEMLYSTRTCRAVLTAVIVGAQENSVWLATLQVTFMPNSSKQMTLMTILNNSSKTQLFKMKSTKPKMFKMRPVYGAVQPKQKAIIKLFFKGLKPGQDVPLKQRFTVVSADAPPGKVNATKMWKAHKYREKIFEAGVAKRKFAILFSGINDRAEEKMGKNVVRKKKAKSRVSSRKKERESSRGSSTSSTMSTVKEFQKRSETLIQRQIEDLDAKMRENKVKEPTVKEKVEPQEKKKIVLIMYRDYPKDPKNEDSLSGDEDDEDSANSQSGQKNLKTKSSVQLGAKKTGPSIMQKKELEKLDEDLLTRQRQSAESLKGTADTGKLL